MRICSVISTGSTIIRFPRIFIIPRDFPINNRKCIFMKNKQILKKALSITLCAVLLGGTAAALPSIVPDIGIEADAAVYGDYEYQELSDGSIRITKYNGTASK